VQNICKELHEIPELTTLISDMKIIKNEMKELAGLKSQVSELAKAMSNQTKATYSLGAMCEKGLSF
jgi:hypothetical protein